MLKSCIWVNKKHSVNRILFEIRQKKQSAGQTEVHPALAEEGGVGEILF